MMKKTFIIICTILLGIPGLAQNQDLDSLLLHGISVESLPDEIIDNYDLKKKKPINDYSLIGVQYGVGLSRTLLNPEFAKQDFAFMPYNIGVTYSRYGKMFGYMPYFGIQVGLFYTQEGYKFRYNTEENYVPVFMGAQSAIMDVIEVPVLAHCHVDFWKMKVILNVGLYGGYRIGIHRYAPEIDVAGLRYQNLTPGYEIKLEDAYVRSFTPFEKRFDYGIKAGLGFGFVFDPVEIHIEAMYKHAFASLFEADYYSQYYYRYSYQMNVIISVGLHFQLGKRIGKTRQQIRREARESLTVNSSISQ